MKKLTLLITIILLLSSKVWSAEKFVYFSSPKTSSLLINSKHEVGIYIDKDCEKGVIIAARNLCSDIEKVCGAKTSIVNDKKNAKIIVSTVPDGKWEEYRIAVDNDRIHITGSDKRGTIYGIYELAEQIGVSPWYWWADVPVRHHDDIYVRCGEYSDGEPAVKYRGIFINDEWPSFGTWANNQFGGINSKMYARMFELLLRLKANYLWPAMWDSRFNEDDPLSPAVADEYGIVMGTSHHEPMMRAHKEYTTRRDAVGPWDYSVNKERLDQFFEDGLRRNRNYDNLITIGMRGDGDVAMGDGDDEDNMKTLKDVITGQREIIERVYGCPASEVPQLWAIFTEVQRYYDAGFTVPDDVTLLFCDNNWGYIRRTGPEKERNRKGGMGMYYHIDMNGGPWNDRWVNTTTAAKLREQLNLAYRTGIDRIWIINVGDLKPKEMPIDFIMRYAWNPDAYPAGRIDDYMVGWARGIFGDENAREIADIVNEYSKLNLERKPEVQTVGIYSVPTGEAQAMMDRWNDLERRTLSLKKRIPSEQYDAFFQLVEYPAVASAGVAKIYLAATMGDSCLMQDLFRRDSILSEKYNKEIAGGKWDGMMLDRHIGYKQWSMPDENKLPPVLKNDWTNGNTGYSPSEVAIMAYDYSRRKAGKDASWVFLPDLGRGKGCMGIDPVTAKSAPEGGAALEYDFSIDSIGESPMKLALGILPTNDINPGRGLRIGVAIDDRDMQTVDARQGYVDTFNEYNDKNIARSNVLKPLPAPAKDIYLSGYGKPMRNEIFDNIRWLSIDLGNVTSGHHTLKIFMIDPEIVIEKIVINPDASCPSYYGKRTSDIL